MRNRKRALKDQYTVKVIPASDIGYSQCEYHAHNLLHNVQSPSCVHNIGMTEKTILLVYKGEEGGNEKKLNKYQQLYSKVTR